MKRRKKIPVHTYRVYHAAVERGVLRLFVYAGHGPRVFPAERHIGLS